MATRDSYQRQDEIHVIGLFGKRVAIDSQTGLYSGNRLATRWINGLVRISRFCSGWSTSKRLAEDFPGRSVSRDVKPESRSSPAFTSFALVFAVLSIIVAASATVLYLSSDKAVEEVVIHGPVEIPVGTDARFVAILKSDRGRPLGESSVEWSSSAPTVLKVDMFGDVTALKPGTATITAKHEDRMLSTGITVISPGLNKPVAGPNLVHHSMWLNPRTPEFADIRVRRAIMMAIDRSQIIENFQEGFREVGFVMAPGSAWDITQEQGCAVEGWCIPFGGHEAQREKAKQILEQAGFDFSKTYTLASKNDTSSLLRAGFVKDQLAGIGLFVAVEPKEPKDLRASYLTGVWGDFTTINDVMVADEPSLGMAQYWGCSSAANLAFFPEQEGCPESVEALLDQFDEATDPVIRKQLSDKLQLAAMSTYTKFPLYWVDLAGRE